MSPSHPLSVMPFRRLMAQLGMLSITADGFLFFLFTHRTPAVIPLFPRHGATHADVPVAEILFHLVQESPVLFTAYFVEGWTHIVMLNNSMQTNSHCPLELAASFCGLFGQVSFESICTVAVSDLNRWAAGRTRSVHRALAAAARFRLCRTSGSPLARRGHTFPHQ